MSKQQKIALIRGHLRGEDVRPPRERPYVHYAGEPLPKGYRPGIDHLIEIVSDSMEPK